jgi:tellurite methyltransferase
MDLSKVYDEKYKNGQYWSAEPNKYVSNYLLKFIKAGKALDLGSGEGRDAIFLAKNGFDVTAVDISEDGIRRMMDASKLLGLSIRGIVSGLKDFRFKEDYDLVLSMAALNFLKDSIRFIDEIKSHTKKGGINCIMVFTEENEFKGFPHMFKKGELRSLYEGWEILDCVEEKDEPHRDEEGGRVHWHARAFLTARKL